jgi:membrane protease YdiL (CAAX protease family)
MTNDELQPTHAMSTTTSEDDPASDHSSFDIRHSSLAPALPPRFGLGGLPYGSLPILIGSLLFALAHIGYGPEPVPLFFLALILGYVYQRTHRIVPSIVAHALFNGASLFALWRVTSAGAQ